MDDEGERRGRAFRLLVPYNRPLLQRGDLPAYIPTEVVDRIIAADADRFRWTTADTVRVLAVSGVAIGLFVAAKILGWGDWVPAAVMGVLIVSLPLLRVVEQRRMHKLMVAQGMKCPRCLQPMFTDTWQTDEEAQFNSMMQGRCPRCFELLDRVMLPPPA